MENLIISLKVVAPLFLLMAIGYQMKRSKIADTHTFDDVNNMTYRVFLPILVFKNIYTSDIASSFNAGLMIFAVCTITVFFVCCFPFVMLVEKENRRRGVLVQGIFRSNFLIFGLPIIASISGDEFTGIGSLVIAAVIPLYNMLSVVALEIFRGKTINYKNIFIGLAKNPLIIASACGIVLLLTGIQLPGILQTTVSSVAQIATPLAFVVLGGSLAFSSIGRDIKPLLIGLAGKLVVFPLLGVTASVLFGFRGVELVVLMVMFGAPTAVSSFTMAKQMDGDSELAGHFVVLGSLLSVVTLFFWTFALKQLGLI